MSKEADIGTCFLSLGLWAVGPWVWVFGVWGLGPFAVHTPFELFGPFEPCGVWR